MSSKNRFASWKGLLLAGLVVVACGGPGGGLVLIVDAEYDPAAVSNASSPISETATSAAQIFTVLAAGKLEEFWLVLTNAESADEGIVRLTVRPLLMGEPDPDPASSIIEAIDIDTSTLAAHPLETFVELFVGDDPGREVAAGDQYAIVVEFVSRATTTDALPIARLLGRDDDGYADGSASTSPDGLTWTNSATDDHIFRTFVLQ